jgi:hypothetical protein
LFFYKIREQEGGTRTSPARDREGKVGNSGRGEVVGKEDRRMHMMQKNVYTCL